MINYFTLYQGRPYLSEQFLYERGVSQNLLDKFCKKFRDGHSSLCAYYQVGKLKWFLYSLLPTRWISRYTLPKTVDEMHALIQMQNEDLKTNTKSHVLFVLNNAWNDPIRWKPFIEKYRGYYLDRDILVRYAKTHALFFEIIEMKKHIPLEIVFEVYQEFEDAVFITQNKNSFRNKVRETTIESIEGTLVHDFKINGRTRYKVDGLILSRVKYYYSSPKKYTYPQILNLVNNERYDRGLDPISLSTIKRILLDRELRNSCDPLRYGIEYAENHIYPYINRKDPEFAELIEVDSTRINIPYQNEEGEEKFMHLCVAMEVNSRKIIGHSLSKSEDSFMILNCLKLGLSNLGFIPKQILHDNHKSYYSSQYRKFSKVAFELGIHFRAARIGNARDKAHIERWFGIFQTEFTNSVFGSLGEGVKTSRVGGRASKELEKLHRKKKYLRTEEQLGQLIAVLIAKYNNSPRSKLNGKSPNEICKQAPKEMLVELKRPDLIKMFYQSKTKSVKNEQISLRHNSRRFHYKIKNKILAKKLNGDEVTIMYDTEDLSSVSIFDNKAQEYYCDLSLDQPINIIPTKKDRARISKNHWSLKKRIEQNLKELHGEIEEGIQQLDAIPIVSLNPQSQLEEVLNEAENKWYSHHLIDKPTIPTIKSKSKSTIKSTSSKKFNQKGSLKLIES
ncbi:MAG: DDE-type integrase/transposase/recombinase [Reichenbachiella sp.]|uniref:DDE-type integrase/transposase/recombinase n=1 Tax=Reichenbachiella sp. TaxID=2184521 RepID=UPI0032967ECC